MYQFIYWISSARDIMCHVSGELSWAYTTRFEDMWCHVGSGLIFGKFKGKCKKKKTERRSEEK